MPKTSRIKRIFQLARVLHTCSSVSTTKKQHKIDPAKIVLPIVELFYAVALFSAAYTSADLITLFGGTSTLLPTLFLAAGLIAILFSLIELISTLYFSSDFSLVATLPFSSVEIVLARLIGSLYTVAPLAALFIFPISLGYGISAGLGIAFYLIVTLSFFLIVPFSIFISAILAMLLMSFVRIFRNRDLLSIIGTVLLLAFVFLTTVLDSGEETSFGEVFFSNLGTFSSFSWFIPIAPLLSRFYETGNIFFFFAVLAIFAVIYAIFYLLADKIYLSSALSPLSASKSKFSKKKSKTSKTESSISSSLLRKELRTIFRTPAILLNGCLTPLICPILIFAPLISNISKIPDLLTQLTEFEVSIENTSEIIPYTLSVALIISLGISFFATMTNNLAYNSLTREGSSFYLMKSLPISYETQLRAKLRPAILISAIGSTPFILIISVLAIYFNLLPLYALPLVLLINLSSIYLLNIIQQFLGTRHPNFSWTNIAVASKDTSLSFIFIGALIIIALIGLSIYAMISVSPLLVILFYSILIPISSYFLGKFFTKKSVNNLKNLEIS